MSEIERLKLIQERDEARAECERWRQMADIASSRWGEKLAEITVLEAKLASERAQNQANYDVAVSRGDQLHELRREISFLQNELSKLRRQRDSNAEQRADCERLRVIAEDVLSAPCIQR